MFGKRGRRKKTAAADGAPTEAASDGVLAAGEGDELGRAITASLVVHAAILVFLIFKSLVYPSKPVVFTPVLRVDLVALPDVLKKDLSQLAPLPPPEKLEDKPAEKPAPAPPAVVKTPKSKSAPQADPDEMVLKPKNQQKPDPKDREKRMKSALARIKALEKVREDTGASPGRHAIVKGNILSPGKSLSADAREAAMSSYYDELRDRMQQFWELPVWLARQKLTAQVRITIDSRGRMRSYQFVKASGNAQFDEAVKRALTSAQPFPAPPDDLAGTLLVDGVSLGFPL